MAAPRLLRVRCTTWDQVEAFYRRKLRRNGRLAMRVPFAAEVGNPVTLALELPNQIVIAVDGTISAVGSGPPGRLAVEVSLFAMTEDLLGQLEAMVGEGRAPDDLDDERRLLAARNADLRRMRQLGVHEVLGVPREASPLELRAGWLAAARREHPDMVARYASPALTAAAEDTMTLVARAYDVMRAEIVADGRGAVSRATVRPAGTGWTATLSIDEFAGGPDGFFAEAVTPPLDGVVDLAAPIDAEPATVPVEVEAEISTVVITDEPPPSPPSPAVSISAEPPEPPEVSIEAEPPTIEPGPVAVASEAEPPAATFDDDSQPVITIDTEPPRDDDVAVGRRDDDSDPEIVISPPDPVSQPIIVLSEIPVDTPPRTATGTGAPPVAGNGTRARPVAPPPSPEPEPPPLEPPPDELLPAVKTPVPPIGAVAVRFGEVTDLFGDLDLGPLHEGAAPIVVDAAMSPAPSGPGDRFVREIRDRLGAGDHGGAQQIALAALEVYTGDRRLRGLHHVALAMAACGRGDRLGAVAALETALAHDPASTEAARALDQVRAAVSPTVLAIQRLFR